MLVKKSEVGLLNFCAARPQAHEQPILGITFVIGDKLRASCCMDGCIKIWKTDESSIDESSLILIFLQ
jgi:hypothetical protein